MKVRRGVQVPSGILVILVLMAPLVGCPPIKDDTSKRTMMFNSYRPFHPMAAPAQATAAGPITPVRFSIRARNPEDRIRRAELSIYEYDLYENGGVPSKRRRETGLWGKVWEQEFPDFEAIDCAWETTSFLRDATLITARVRVTDGNGKTKIDEWSFAVGAWPFGDEPIPIWKTGEPSSRISVVFVADRGDPQAQQSPDYADPRMMLPDIAKLVDEGYHRNNGVMQGRHLWQFYYSPQLGHITGWNADPRFVELPSGVTGSGMNFVVAVIHRRPLRDWAADGYFGTEPTEHGTACHEAGHAVFDLGDEYCAPDQYTWVPPMPDHNIFQASSEAEAREICPDPGRIGSSWWRVEDHGDCLMVDDDDTDPGFGSKCLELIEQHYRRLDP